MDKSEDMFIVLGGLRIRRGKTHKMVAEQLNRIGERCAEIVEKASLLKIAHDEWCVMTEGAELMRRRICVFDIECAADSGDILDAMCHGDLDRKTEGKMFSSRAVVPSGLRHTHCVRFAPFTPEAVF